MFDRRQLCVVCLTTFFSVVPTAWAQSNQTDTTGRPETGTSQSQTQTSPGQMGQDQSQTGMSQNSDINWEDAHYSKGEIGEVQMALKNKGLDPGSSTSGQSSKSGTDTTSQSSTVGSTTGQEEDQAELARKAADVLREITQAPDKSIPSELLERAQGIAVIPNVIKGAFIVGGRWGEGLMLGRAADGTWKSNPSFIQIGGASVGFQAGVQSTDLILVFTSKDAINALLDGKLELGGEAAVAAGPVGRQASAGTDVKLSGPIYSYSRNKGVFAGVSLDGAVITIDDSANQKVYGSGTTGTQLLKGEMPAQASAQASPVVQPFVEAVRTNTGAKGKAE